MPLNRQIKSKNSDRLDILAFALLLAGLAWLVSLGVEQAGYYWQWYRLPRFLFFTDDSGLHAGLLLQGLWVTLQVTGLSFVLAFTIGLLTALCRISGSS